MPQHPDTRDLWEASWDALCRLGRSLGLRVGPGPERDRRTKLVDAVGRRMVEDELQHAATKRRTT